MSNLQNSKISKYIDTAQEVWLNVDYLRFSFYEAIPYYDHILNQIDFDNSPQLFDEENEIQYDKVRLDIWECIIVSKVYEWIPVRIMMYAKYHHHLARKSGYAAKLDFYWGYFRLVQIGFLPENYLHDVIKHAVDSQGNSQDPAITRIDYAVDLFYSKAKKFPRARSMFFKLNKKTKINERSDGEGSVNSRSVGNKSTKRYFIRMYDKLVDIQNKWKSTYYWDYLQWKSVYRYEVQFWPHFCKPNRYSSYTELLNKTKSFFWDDRFEGCIFYSYDATKNFKSDTYRTNYFKQFWGRWETILKAWFNPYQVLMSELDIRDSRRNRQAIIQYLKGLYSDVRYKHHFEQLPYYDFIRRNRKHFDSLPINQ